MRNVIFSAALGLFAVPAMAGSIQGTWATNPSDCSGVYPETQVKITGNKIQFIETTCELTNPTGLRDMPGAKLYDMACSGEGSAWTERAFIGTSVEDLIVYSRGVARNYSRC